MSNRGQSHSGTKTYLGDLLLRRGKIRSYQLRFLLQLQKAYHAISRPIRLGELLVAHRALNLDSLDEALLLQQAYAHNGGPEVAELYGQQEEATQTKKRD